MIKTFGVSAVFAATILLAACGGGGGSSPSIAASSTVKSTFTQADFSGQTMYLVDKENGAQYALATFAPNGTGATGNSVKSGTPVANKPFTWAISNGDLQINNQGTVINVKLVAHDPANRYYRINASALGVTNVGGIFYDQSTGLNQAQQFVANNGPL